MILDRKSVVPLHRQVAAYIEEKIRKGEWPIGTRLPSQRVLAARLGVNRSTIVTAFEELAAQGLIEGRKGGGTIIINNTWGLMNKTLPADWGSYVESGYSKPNLPMIQTINTAEFSPNITRMGTGELGPDLLPTAPLTDLIRSAPTHVMTLGYQEPKGDLRLREQISSHLKQLDMDVSPASILIVSGALQALQLISIGLLDRGSTLLLEKPSYLYSVHVFQSAGMHFVGLPMDSEGMEIRRLAEYRKRYHGAIIYTIPSYHNPTGTLMSERRRRALLSLARKERLPIIEDDVYGDLWLDAPPPAPLKSHDPEGNVIYIGSLSKVLSPGLRIGWIVAPESVVSRLADIKMQSDYGSSSLSQWVAGECLRTGLYDRQAAFVRHQLKIRRDFLVDLLEKNFPDLARWTVPSGGFYIWLELTVPVHPNTLFERALQQGVLLNPGILYDRAAGQFLRLSYAYASFHDMEKAIHSLRKLVLEQASRHG